jgi:hypothetical protein
MDQLDQVISIVVDDEEDIEKKWGQHTKSPGPLVYASWGQSCLHKGKKGKRGFFSLIEENNVNNIKQIERIQGSETSL